jgi:c-di-GMP-binding flagellar brake protein YcgR
MPDNDQDKRLYRRVDVLIPFGFRTIGRGVVEASLQTAPEPVVVSDDPIRGALERIERKVDRLLARLESENLAPAVRPTPINLSGAGVRFPSDDPIEQGEFVDVVMVLPGDSQVRIRAFAEVVRQRLVARPSGAVYEIAASFLHLPPKDREAIIRYTFQANGR